MFFFLLSFLDREREFSSFRSFHSYSFDIHLVFSMNIKEVIFIEINEKSTWWKITVNKTLTVFKVICSLLLPSGVRLLCFFFCFTPYTYFPFHHIHNLCNTDTILLRNNIVSIFFLFSWWSIWYWNLNTIQNDLLSCFTPSTHCASFKCLSNNINCEFSSSSSLRFFFVRVQS